MRHEVVWSERAVLELEDLSRHTRKILLAWVKKNLDGCEDPYTRGSHLPGGPMGAWRYSIGRYRLIAQIRDETVQILGVASGVGERMD